MKKKKVLMLGWEFPPHINGGLGVACHGLSEALKNHVDLEIILPPSSLLAPYSDSGGLYAGDLDARVREFRNTAIEQTGDYQFDLIHAHDWMTFPATLTIKEKSGKPLIVHIHSLSYDRTGPDDGGWIFQLEKHAMEQADRVITVSEYTRSICSDFYGIDPHKIHPVHNGLHPIAYEKASPASQDQLVLFLGRMTRQKAPLNFVKIAGMVQEKIPDARFVMAGTGDQLSEVISESIRLNLKDSIEFPGFLDREAINQLFEQTSVYCMPSISEPFGLSALEAAQFGIPVVMSKQSGAAEALPRSRTANHWELETMANHIIDLLQNEDAHRQASIASLEDQQKFTWAKAAEKTQSLYEQVPTSWQD